MDVCNRLVVLMVKCWNNTKKDRTKHSVIWQWIIMVIFFVRWIMIQNLMYDMNSKYGCFDYFFLDLFFLVYQKIEYVMDAYNVRITTKRDLRLACAFARDCVWMCFIHMCGFLECVWILLDCVWTLEWCVIM